MLVVLSGGGTAGHINPALALADTLAARGHDVRFAGTPNGAEARLVREAGIDFTPFEASGFNRNHPTTIFKGVYLIQKSTGAARAMPMPSLICTYSSISARPGISLPGSRWHPPKA